MFKLILCFMAAFFALTTAVGDNVLNYNYLMFSQSWPAPKGINWTVQGLWSKQSGEKLEGGPKNCVGGKADAFNSTEVEKIMPDLLGAWNSNFRRNYHKHTNMKSLDFWKEEWDVYGTCASHIGNFGTASMYFQKSIDLHEKYPIKSILNSASIVRGSFYLVSEITDAIRNHTGKVPLLHCDYVAIDDDDDIIMLQFLDWIGICLDRFSLEPIDCPSNATQFCHHQLVVYPVSEEEMNQNGKSVLYIIFGIFGGLVSLALCCSCFAVWSKKSGGPEYEPLLHE